jgi:type I restriction enzyme R subunit
LPLSKSIDNTHIIGAGSQQALDHSQILDIPFVFSSDGDGFKFQNKTVTDGDIETELDNDSFPSPEMLWEKYKIYRGITTPEEKIVEQSYYDDGGGRKPRYYLRFALSWLLKMKT